MILKYKRQIPALLTVIALTAAACGQNAKVKTITIVNGDTTITEKNVDEKDLAELDKQINVTINDNGSSTGEQGDSSKTKKIVKKIVVNGKEDEEAEAMAFAYSFGDGKDGNMEVTTDENGKETKIIIRKGDDDKSDSKEKKTVIKKSIVINDDKKEKESLNVNININNTTAKVEIQTSSKEPLNVSVLDENGKQVFYDTQKAGGNYTKEIPLGKKGTYFLNLIQNKKSTTEKIVIE